MRPVLQALSASGPQSTPALAAASATALAIAPQAQAEVLPFNRQPVVEARVELAARDLRIAGLVQAVSGGLQLTDQGRQVLNSGPPVVNTEFLMQFEPYATEQAQRRQRRGA